MDNEKDLIKNFYLNEYASSSNSLKASERMEAWRQQAVILQHLTKEEDVMTQLAVLKQHTNKMKYVDQVGFAQDRAKAVDEILNGFVSDMIPDTISLDFDDIEPTIEKSCRGEYMSCRYNEITQQDLDQLMQSGTGEGRRDFSKASSSQVEQAISKETANGSKYMVEKYLRHNADDENQKKEKDFQDTTNRKGSNSFRTAREELSLQNIKRYGDIGARNNVAKPSTSAVPLINYGLPKKTLGARRNVHSSFVLPIRVENVPSMTTTALNSSSSSHHSQANPAATSTNGIVDERLANIDPRMVELIQNEIMHKYKPIDWGDIAGLEYAKSIIKEAVVYPMLRPDIFTGLRRPPRGILLFGPPGTGKTLIGKCIASTSKSTFFSISASSLTSKWIGEGEKMVRALFAVAAVHQPSVVFFDEIDSLLCSRSETEHESSRRLKTEFLVQLDGAATYEDDRILIVGATNRPQELDEAARRRLVRRLYIPLPELKARVHILKNLLPTVRNILSEDELKEIATLADGYSGADMESLCREASMEPIRSIPAEEISFFKENNVRPVILKDFQNALRKVRPSVSQQDLMQYTEWNRIYGAGN